MSYSLAPVRRLPGVCAAPGRPALWYAPGDLVSVGGIDGVYVRRVPGSRGHAHILRVADLPSGMSEASYAQLESSGLLLPGPLTYGDLIRFPRSSSCLAVWGSVEVLVPAQTSLF